MQNTIIAVLIAFAVGFGSGFYTKGKFVQADQVSVVKEVRLEDANGIANAQAKNDALAARQDIEDTNINKAKSEVKRYAPKQAIHTEQAQGSVGQEPGLADRAAGATDHFASCRDADSLNNGELGVLNAARRGTPFEPFGQVDGEGKAAARNQVEAWLREPSGATTADLIDNDLDIVGMYRKLADAHDELVEEVKEFQRKQRERLAK